MRALGQGEAEVDDDRLAVGPHDDVLGLEVAMHDAVLVAVGDALGYAAEEGYRALGRHRRLLLDEDPSDLPSTNSVARKGVRL
jgi:hypothetical protein